MEEYLGISLAAGADRAIRPQVLMVPTLLAISGISKGMHLTTCADWLLSRRW